MTFGSKTLGEHLVRGLVGAVGVALGVGLAASCPWLALAAASAALVALRGCPMCWTMGLLETLHARTASSPETRGCATGTCDQGRRR